MLLRYGAEPVTEPAIAFGRDHAFLLYHAAKRALGSARLRLKWRSLEWRPMRGCAPGGPGRMVARSEKMRVCTWMYSRLSESGAAGGHGHPVLTPQAKLSSGERSASVDRGRRESQPWFKLPRRAVPRFHPLTRPAPAGEYAGGGPPSPPHGRGGVTPGRVRAPWPPGEPALVQTPAAGSTPFSPPHPARPGW
jgi:hypothetical protein